MTKLNGDVMIFAFADLKKHLCMPPKPFRVTIENGIIADYDRATAPHSFTELIDAIKAEETDVWVREFGLGMLVPHPCFQSALFPMGVDRGRLEPRHGKGPDCRQHYDL